ncbi:L-serine dehydratase [Granulicella pectinivorans]|uniref:L-serine dehydratase n=1 Tax=Granulicella pectinivorans TaxID=474950 RepID=A0A1I6N082_9BACT|nr:L-serine ammonia-lyase [Granulicella pectinivorans]SFS21356.1 L-serine dehydratase [Granulicella pectinivorans]
MNTSLFELFKIGIGPSSSHTVGPMRAALRFVRELDLSRVERVRVELFGSLALTGVGHATDRAVLLGLLGEAPDTIDPEAIEKKLAEIRATGLLALLGQRVVAFQEPEDLLFRRNQMYPDPGVPTHPNGMRFRALDAMGEVLREDIFYSVGGGFIVSAEEFATATNESGGRVVPYPFSSGATLLETAARHGLTIAELVMANEVALLETSGINRPASDGSGEDRVRGGILALWRVMMDCTARGIATEGILPGGLNVRRRAHRLAARLTGSPVPDPLAAIDWVTLWAMAVNEENAAGGRVVTAPTNGAAGVIPAIGHYLRFVAEADEDALVRYFLTAAAIGILYKENASISGAEVGCQGEVGVACSMAAGGLVAALGGTNEQVEHAAEIGMEHNLGMTCDPIGGLVQIPCIERNGMGAVKAINAARMAMHETEGHKLSLDQVIETMYQTGMDMQSRYKETSLAGLALNIIEC